MMDGWRSRLVFSFSLICLTRRVLLPATNIAGNDRQSFSLLFHFVCPARLGEGLFATLACSARAHGLHAAKVFSRRNGRTRTGRGLSSSTDEIWLDFRGGRGEEDILIDSFFCFSRGYQARNKHVMEASWVRVSVWEFPRSHMGRGFDWIGLLRVAAKRTSFEFVFNGLAGTFTYFNGLRGTRFSVFVLRSLVDLLDLLLFDSVAQMPCYHQNCLRARRVAWCRVS